MVGAMGRRWRECQPLIAPLSGALHRATPLLSIFFSGPDFPNLLLDSPGDVPSMSHSVSACSESNLSRNNTRHGGNVCSVTQADLKKQFGTKWELQVEFYLGQNGDCSQGDSTSALRNCSKEAGGKVKMHVIWMKRGYGQSNTYFSRRFLLVSWSLC